MRYEMISADCHVDLCWLPPELFTENASSALKERMPFVADGPQGRHWKTKKGANLGLVNGMGSGGRQYIPGKIHRADRMAETGLYEDGKRGVRRRPERPCVHPCAGRSFAFGKPRHANAPFIEAFYL